MRSQARVHASGFGLISPFGRGVRPALIGLSRGESRTTYRPEWAAIGGLQSHVGALVENLSADAAEIPRLKRRTMSRMSEMACLAAVEALAHAGLTAEELSASSTAAAAPRAMIIAGSTTGSAAAYETVFSLHARDRSVREVPPATVFKCMTSSVALNLAQFLGFRGPVLAVGAACATGAQSLVLGAQMIRAGQADIVLAGGADECHFTTAMTFDLLGAASRNFNSEPARASRPFDKGRDGIVAAEGAAMVVLESEASLRRRGRKSRALLLGGAHFDDGKQIFNPSRESASYVMRLAMRDAGLGVADIGYVNAHATSTEAGDLAEAQAVHDVFGFEIAISGYKGHMGHSFAASGAAEFILACELAREGHRVGTLNLDEIDPRLPPLDYLRGVSRHDGRAILSNSFAFGGVYTSLVIGFP